jgi:hypothetical protein
MSCWGDIGFWMLHLGRLSACRYSSIYQRPGASESRSRPFTEITSPGRHIEQDLDKPTGGGACLGIRRSRRRHNGPVRVHFRFGRGSEPRTWARLRNRLHLLTPTNGINTTRSFPRPPSPTKTQITTRCFNPLSSSFSLWPQWLPPSA